MRRTLLAVLVVLALIGAACGGGDDEDAAGDDKAADSSTQEADSSSDEADEDDDGSAASSSGGGGGKDACAALPRETIQQVVGADPGEGELERAGGEGGATICRYYGDAQVTVEIDPVADLESARTSLVAYGEKCEEIDDIGDDALFCRGGFAAKGFTGQVVWVDGDRTFFVVYNFGEAEPSLETTLELARRLDA